MILSDFVLEELSINSLAISIDLVVEVIFTLKLSSVYIKPSDSQENYLCTSLKEDTVPQSQLGIIFLGSYSC